MELHYNAFISYKHADLDNKVAESIVKNLEHYHIPGKIREATGIKKINRIFRDKDELPITNDLNDTIANALYNSDYLIVICSTNTCLSTWVEKEIEIFLRNHTRDCIFTVLADGEPSEVIPKILLTDEKIVENEDGTIQSVSVPLEPLSCDFRLPAKRVKSEEVPRLVAALIGCAYDELVDRARQYKTKRLTAIMAGALAVVLGFAGYMVYSNVRINENYIQSLKNQSQFLAYESLDLNSSGQRIAALQLALEALPNEKTPQRPVIPEALSAILESTMAYQTPSGSNIDAAWSYTMQDEVRDFEIDEAGRFLAAMDAAHNVRIWDTLSHEVVFEWNAHDYYEEAQRIKFVSEDKFIVEGNQLLLCYDTKSGEVLWKNDKQLYTGDDNISNMFYSLLSINAYDSDSFLVFDNEGYLLKVSLDNGDISALTQFIPNEAINFDAESAVLSPSKDKIAFASSYVSDGSAVLYVLDLNNMRVKQYSFSQYDDFDNNGYCHTVYWVSDDYICCDLSAADEMANITVDSGSVVTTTINDNHSNLYCIDANDMHVVWTDTFTYNSTYAGSHFAAMPDTNEIAYYAGNTSSIMDAKTGETHFTVNFNDPIIWMGYNSRTDLRPLYITQDGAMGSLDDNITKSYYFPEALIKATINNGGYVNQYKSNEILYYSPGVCDDNWEMFSGIPDGRFPYYSRGYVSDEVVLSLETDGALFLRMSDPYDGRFLRDVKLDDDENVYSRSEIAGIYNDKAYVFKDKAGLLSVCVVSVDDGEMNEIELENDSDALFGLMYSFSEGEMAFYNNYYAYDYIVTYDYDADLSESYALDIAEDSHIDRIKYDAESHMIVLSGNCDIIYNTETGEAVYPETPEYWSGTKGIVINNEFERIILSGERDIIVRDFDGNIVSSIRMDSSFYDPYIYSPTGRAEEALLLIGASDGNLYRFALDTGEYIGKTPVSIASYVIEDDMDTPRWYFDEDDHQMYFCHARNLDIIDTNEWINIYTINSCIGYHEGSDRFLVYTEGDTWYDFGYGLRLGYYKRYSVDELIERGREMVDGIEMTDDFKAKYGIE